MPLIPPSLLDSDTVSLIMRKNPIVIARAQAYLQQHKKLTFSIITRYEILRGLKCLGATRKLDEFEEFCRQNIILPLTDAIIVRAAEIYADLYRRGQLISDADILIAATAIEHNLALVTNNLTHFQRILNLQVTSWASL
ncbi:MAG: type II toxin-antitoxin system VapC family toxin [Armatimonadota bacterium]